VRYSLADRDQPEREVLTAEPHRVSASAAFHLAAPPARAGGRRTWAPWPASLTASVSSPVARSQAPSWPRPNLPAPLRSAAPPETSRALAQVLAWHLVTAVYLGCRDERIAL
jgi:hypothetical protein